MYQNLKIHYGNLVSVMMLKKIKKEYLQQRSPRDSFTMVSVREWESESQ